GTLAARINTGINRERDVDAKPGALHDGRHDADPRTHRTFELDFPQFGACPDHIAEGRSPDLLGGELQRRRAIFAVDHGAAGTVEVPVRVGAKPSVATVAVDGVELVPETHDSDRVCDDPAGTKPRSGDPQSPGDSSILQTLSTPCAAALRTGRAQVRARFE